MEFLDLNKKETREERRQQWMPGTGLLVLCYALSRAVVVHPESICPASRVRGEAP